MLTRSKAVSHPKHRWLLVVLFATGVLNAQTTLVPSSTRVVTERASLTLSLDSSAGVAPTALQWTFQYSPAAILSISVEDGASATAAGKTLICMGDAAALTGMAVGLNSRTIADGIVARITAVLAAGQNDRTLNITDALGVSAGGEPIPISVKGCSIIVGAVTGVHPPIKTTSDGQIAEAYASKNGF